MLAKPPPINWWESNSASLHQTQGASVKNGEVLCARRGTGALQGLWEFPGGKIEPGETPRAALKREIEEELACTIQVGDLITTTDHEYDFGVVSLTTFFCKLVSGTPTLTEHTSLRWLAPDRLRDLAWAPADEPAVTLVNAHHAGSNSNRP